MRIYVCVKQVPDSEAKIQVMGDTEYNREVAYVINPYDEYAIEEAVRLVEKSGDGEVIALCVGGNEAPNALKSAMAIGAHRSILIKTDNQFPGSDLIANALARVIEQEGAPDIIFTGKQTMDSETMQTAYRLGHTLGLPVVNNVVKFALSDGAALVDREMGGGNLESLRVKTPCVIGANKGLNEVRYPKMQAILKAKKKEIKVLELSDLGVTDESNITMKGFEAVQERTEAKILEGTTDQVVSSLVDILTEERVI